MSLRPEAVGEIPAETARVARAAFPKGTVVTRLRDAFDALYEDEDFRALYPARGQPGLTPWRLALVTVFQFLEHLSDRRAADAVCARIDWKYALGLELTDPGFHFSVLGEFRARLVAGGAEPLLPSRRVCCHPRPSQTRTCRFPASGSSGESFAPDGVVMDDPGRWQRALLQECRQTRPGVGALTIPSRQPSLPDPHNLVGIPTHPSTVPRHAVVGVMAPHHGRQVGMLDGDRPMPVLPAPVRHPRQRSGIAALGRDLSHHVDPFARLAPDMSEAEEVELNLDTTFC